MALIRTLLLKNPTADMKMPEKRHNKMRHFKGVYEQ